MTVSEASRSGSPRSSPRRNGSSASGRHPVMPSPATRARTPPGEWTDMTTETNGSGSPRAEGPAGASPRPSEGGTPSLSPENLAVLQLTRKDFVSDQEVRWCPGCGDYSILAQTQKVMPDFGYPKENIVFI